MPVPAGVETVTVSSGEPLILPDGTPIQGRLLFTGPELVTIAADNTIVCGTSEATLADGEFSITLIATDATGMDPTGWTYKVTGQFINAPNWVKYISLPQATPSVNLSDIVAASSSSGTSFLISQTDADTRYVNVSGDTMTGDLTLSGASTDLTVGGTATVTGATSLSTLSTSGAATLNSASVTGNATVGGTLGVTGATTLSSTLAVTGASALDDVNTTGPVVVRSVASAPAANTLPLGSTAAAANHGLQIVSSFAGGEDDGAGTDSTGRISVYSYQRAATNSFGETFRHFLMRQDAKSMLAWYGPQLTGTQTHGYDGNRDALTTGVTWKPWAWLGAHYEANDHASTHGHISIEVPDSTGALQTRFEIQFADRDTGAIGLDKSFIISNDSDFAIRQSGGESFRIVAPAGTEKRIDFMGDAHGDSTTRRWKLRSTSTAESGSDAGSDFELVRYDDSGVAQSATFLVKRSNGHVGFGTALSDITAQITAKTSGDRVLKASVTAEGTASTPVVSIETTTASKRAFDFRLTNDSVSRLRMDAASGSGSGTLTFGDGTTADVNLFRNGTNELKTDDSFVVGTRLTVGAALNAAKLYSESDGTISAGTFASSADGTASLGTVIINPFSTSKRALDIRLAADTVSRLRVDMSGTGNGGTIVFGDGTTADTNLYRSAANTLKTDDSFIAADIALTGAATSTDVFTAQVTGDTQKRIIINAGGGIDFGPGNGAVDTNLYRDSANILRTDDSLTVGTNLSVAGTATVTGAASLNAGGSFGNTLTGTGSASTTVMVATLVTADTFDRFRILSSGAHEWGSGSGARDVTLYRNAANQLKTDDKFLATAGIGVGNSAAATTLGTVTRKIEVFDASGASIGFVPVYDAIT